MSGLRTLLRKLPGGLRRLLARYPDEPGVRPEAFAGLAPAPPGHAGTDAGSVLFEQVPDKFYFLLFGAIRLHLHSVLHGSARLVAVRSLNAAVGSGLTAELRRCAGVAWLESRQWERAYGELMDGIAYRSAPPGNPFAELADRIRARRLWRRLQHGGGNPSIEIDGMEVADLVIDSYLRLRPSPAFDAADPFVYRLIRQALRDARRAARHFAAHRPTLYLSSYTTYLEHGIAVRVALRNAVTVWSFGSLNHVGKRLSPADPHHTQATAAYRQDFATLDRQQERLAQAREHLEARLSGRIDAATSYMQRSAYASPALSLPEGLAGAVIVFLHDFYDSPHIYPELVFDDFWSWIRFTIEALREAGQRFFLKPHPNQIAISDTAVARLRTACPDLAWLPAEASNAQLAQAGIACGVTVYGTVAHELAFLGVPSIACARHPHHAFDFCRTAASREEYARMLRDPAAVPVEPGEMQRQALEFYYMHNLHGSESELALRRAYVEFWRACNAGSMDEAGILQAFRRLVDMPAFAGFVQTLPCGAPRETGT